MSSGLYRRQFVALKGIAEDLSLDPTTPTGSFNEKFCWMCRFIVEELGDTFVPLTGGTFTARKANGLWQVATSLGVTSQPTAKSYRDNILISAKALWDFDNDGTGPEFGSSVDWRVYVYLAHTVIGPAAQDELLQWLDEYSSEEFNDRIGTLTLPQLTNRRVLTLDGVGDYVNVGAAQISPTAEYELTVDWLSGAVGERTGGLIDTDNRFYLQNIGSGDVKAVIGSLTDVLNFSLNTSGYTKLKICGNGDVYKDGVLEGNTGGSIASTGSGVFIGALYNAGSPSLYNTMNIAHAKITGWGEYTFEESKEDTVYDVSGNGNDATIVNNSALATMWGTTATGLSSHMLEYGFYNDYIGRISSHITGVASGNFIYIGSTSYLTLDAALTAAVSGDVIELGNGTFTPTITDVPAGVNITGYLSPTFDNTGTYIDGRLVLQGGSTIKNVSIADSGSSVIRAEGTGNIIDNCYIDGEATADHAVLMIGFNSIMKNCTALNSGTHTVAIKGGGHSVTNCTLESSPLSVVVIKADSSQADDNTTHDITITNNDIEGLAADTSARCFSLSAFDDSSEVYDLAINNNSIVGFGSSNKLGFLFHTTSNTNASVTAVTAFKNSAIDVTWLSYNTGVDATSIATLSLGTIYADSGLDGDDSNGTYTVTFTNPAYTTDLLWYTPALLDGTAAADGNAITNFGGYVHNGAEVSVVQTDFGVLPSVVTPWGTATRGADVNSKPSYVFQSLGSELVVNGGFTPPGTGWTVFGESTVITGVGRVYSSAGASSGFFQNSTIASGTKYLVGYEVTESIIGNVYIFGMGGSGNPIIKTIGVHEEVRTGDGATSQISFSRTGITDISIDNVSVKEVLSQYTVSNDGAQWEIEELISGETWTNATNSTFPPLIGWSVGSLGTAAPTLEYTVPWITAGEYAEFSYSDFLALASGYGGTWLKWTSIDGVCHLVATGLYDWTRMYTPAEYLRNSRYFTDCASGASSLVPAEVTPGTGIGPGLAWADNGDGKVLLVEDA